MPQFVVWNNRINTSVGFSVKLQFSQTEIFRLKVPQKRKKVPQKRKKRSILVVVKPF